jgi:hypothetical protein
LSGIAQEPAVTVSEHTHPAVIALIERHAAKLLSSEPRDPVILSHSPSFIEKYFAAVGKTGSISGTPGMQKIVPNGAVSGGGYEDA